MKDVCNHAPSIAGRGKPGLADNAIAVEVFVEAHLDFAEQIKRHFVILTFPSNDLAEFCVEIKRLKAMRTVAKVLVDLVACAGGQFAVEKRFQFSECVIAIRHEKHP